MTTQLHFTAQVSDESAPWLVLIHGLFGDMDNLAVVRRHFAVTHNIINIDLPDHGKSPHLDTFSLQACADGIKQAVNQTTEAKVTLLGHSLGGKAAMLCALQNPELVSRLIVADIAPATYDARHNSIIEGLRSVDMQQVSKRSDADKQLAAYIPETGIRQFLLKSLTQNDQGQWHWRFNLEGLAASYDNVRGWPHTDLQFSLPTLFIKGNESDYLLAEHQSAIATLFPKAKAHIVEGAGHWIHAQKPDAFNSAVEGFFRRTDSQN